MKSITDFRFIIGFMLAHILIFFTFHDQKVFWYILTASMLILISYSIVNEELDDEVTIPVYLMYGILSGLLLFCLFFLSDIVFKIIQLPVQDDISRLYKLFSPSLFWHFLSLVLIAVPGEEIFWRGFIQKKLIKYTTFWKSIFISSLLYASVNIYTGEWILVFATFSAGLIWGYLYAWKRSIPLVIVSHLVFDLLLFLIFPLS